MDQLIAEKNFKKLEIDFSSCGDMSHPNDTWVFTQHLMTILDSIVQYNNQVPGMNIEQVCQYMTNPSMTPYQGLVRLVQVRDKRSILHLVNVSGRQGHNQTFVISEKHNERTNELMNERAIERTSEQTNEQADVRAGERTNESNNEWMNERMNGK